MIITLEQLKWNKRYKNKHTHTWINVLTHTHTLIYFIQLCNGCMDVCKCILAFGLVNECITIKQR